MDTMHLFFPRIRSGAPYLYIKKEKKVLHMVFQAERVCSQ